MANNQFLSGLKPLASTPTVWNAFVEMLDAQIEQHQRKLEQSTDMAEVFKAQGAIAVLRRFYFIKDEINNAK